jgi:hypothetical protein
MIKVNARSLMEVNTHAIYHQNFKTKQTCCTILKKKKALTEEI